MKDKSCYILTTRDPVFSKVSSCRQCAGACPLLTNSKFESPQPPRDDRVAVEVEPREPRPPRQSRFFNAFTIPVLRRSREFRGDDMIGESTSMSYRTIRDAQFIYTTASYPTHGDEFLNIKFESALEFLSSGAPEATVITEPTGSIYRSELTSFPDDRYVSFVYGASNALQFVPHRTEFLERILEEWPFKEESSALKAMTPAIKTSVSLPNFLYELKDFRRSLNTVKSLGSYLGSFGRRSSVLDNASQAFLESQYGLPQTIRDAQEIWRGLASLKVRLARFLADSGKGIQRRHFRDYTEDVSWYEDMLREIVLGYVVGDDISPVRVRLEPLSIAHPKGLSRPLVNHCYTMDYTYTVETLHNMDVSLAALLQTLGLKPSAATLWNALPWSFIVDWFWKVGDFLEKYDVDVIEAVVEKHAWYQSTKLFARVHVSQEAFTLNSPSYRKIYPRMSEIPVGYLTVYRRILGLPPADYTDIQAGAGLTMKKQAISLALIHQLSKKR